MGLCYLLDSSSESSESRSLRQNPMACRNTSAGSSVKRRATIFWRRRRMRICVPGSPRKKYVCGVALPRQDVDVPGSSGENRPDSGSVAVPNHGGLHEM